MDEEMKNLWLAAGKQGGLSSYHLILKHLYYMGYTYGDIYIWISSFDKEATPINFAYWWEYDINS